MKLWLLQFIKALQTSVGLVSYLCGIDSAFHLSDKLFGFRGPVVISDVCEDLHINDSNGSYQFNSKTQKISTVLDFWRNWSCFSILIIKV